LRGNPPVIAPFGATPRTSGIGDRLTPNRSTTAFYAGSLVLTCT
jgi:hypothetical protein